MHCNGVETARACHQSTAAYLDATAGNLPGDPYFLSQPEKPWLASLEDRPKPLRIGFTLMTPWGPEFAPEVAQALLETAELLEELGNIVERHDFQSDLEAAWFHYDQVNSVQTVLDFEATGRSSSADDRSPRPNMPRASA